MSKVKQFKRMFKKHWITIWLAIAIIALCGIAAYAKFNNMDNNYTKRVVSTGSNDKTLFTSNLLNISNSKHSKTVAKGFSQDSSFDINIYNYERTKPGSFYPNTIHYALTAALVKSDAPDAEEYDLSDPDDLEKISTVLGDNTIRLYALSNGSISGEALITLGSSTAKGSTSEELVPDSESGGTSNSYRLVIPKEATDSGIYIKVTAEPSDGYSDIPDSIGGVFFVQTQNINMETGWVGYINDSKTVTPSEYDAFNFRITGSGTATKVLKWNSTYVQPNKQQLSELFNVTLTADMSQISISFPLADNGSLYDIQFYVKDETARTYINGFATMDALIASNIITLEDP